MAGLLAPHWGCRAGVGNQTRDQIHEEIEGTAVARMLDLPEIFELVIDRLDD